jgi:transcriptional regulator, arsR family
MRHVTKYVYVMKCVTMDSGMNCITEVTKMQEMLLDRRTQSLVNDYVPEGEILDELVCFFTIFADYTRLRMISALAISEMCVTDLSRLLRLNQTTVSHQLRLLKNLNAVTTRRQGKVIFYSLRNELLNDVLLKGVEFLGY